MPISIKGGVTVAGYTVGILCLRSTHPLLPGNVQHAQSFDAPVLYHVIDLDDPWPMMRGEPQVADMLAEGVTALARQGARAVAGACGSFGYYQKAVAATAPVPVFLSILTQLPFLLQAMPQSARIAVIPAVGESMNARIYEQCGIDDPSRLHIAPMRGRPVFDALLDDGTMHDVEALRRETVECAVAAAREPGVAAILIQCSELPPFAADIQAATGLPVFDMTTLIRWLALTTNCQSYSGLIHRTLP
ncbi:aspartate/glutamate racemase family protein [Sphingosinicella xenopeptidilytica]|uniref:Aspartate/glutamate racemase family protein n=1 Tax=Sphingosinicella xenopeptidilytica TaxID=364098 RepID=A0ABW3C3S7_SPHXN